MNIYLNTYNFENAWSAVAQLKTRPSILQNSVTTLFGCGEIYIQLYSPNIMVAHK